MWFARIQLFNYYLQFFWFRITGQDAKAKDYANRIKAKKLAMKAVAAIRPKL